MSSKGWGKREYQPRAKIDSKLSCLTMFRAPVARALNSSRLIAGTGVTVGSTGRRAVTTWIVEDVRNAKYGTGSMSLLILAALGAGSAVFPENPSAHAGSAADPDTKDGEKESSPIGAPVCISSKLPSVLGTAEDAHSPASWTALSAGFNGSPGGHGNHGAPAAAPGGGGGEKLGLRESADLVRAGLKDFRQKLAAKGVACPAVDFRQEEDPARAPAGTATISAAFFLPRSANILRILSAMAIGEQVLEVKPMLGDPGAAIGFWYKDRTGCLLIRQAPSGPHSYSGSVHLYRDGGFTREDLAVLLKGYQEAWSGVRGQDDFYRFVIAPAEPPGQVQGGAVPVPPRRGSAPAPPTPGDKVAAGTERLRQLGVEVHEKGAQDAPGWDSLVGYADVKQEIEDTLVMPLRHPEAFDNIARKTRARFESNRPKAVLFEGPPGTGKTLSARVIAGRSDQPMVHIPVEGIMSKWYGESEKKLSAIFDACDDMGGAIIFIDEVDALAGSRDKGDMHEATRRILSVILQKVEGFDGGSKSTLICATNRKSDLDAALLSRFQLTIRFGLPDAETRREVFGVYAKQLCREDLGTLASISGGMSCRDIKETCQHAERRWASKLVRGQETGELPSLEEYVYCLEKRSTEGAWRSRPAVA